MQALLRFPGLQQVIRWSLTLSHGVSPSVCQVDIAPQFGVPAATGTLEILFGAVRLQFPGCAIDCAQIRRGPGGMVVGLTLLDRRWKWRFGEINGRYNLRTVSGVLDRRTEKTPQQLAVLLLSALGESGFSVSELPNLTRPEIDWCGANPAHELAELCASLGCRVVLGIDNRVAIRHLGQGALLPNLPVQRTQTFGIDPPTRPDSIKVLGGVTRYQTRFRLEAVGLDRDDGIRPLDELAYAPKEGWSREPFVGFPNLPEADDRARATSSVYRWYRILCTAPDNTRGLFRFPGEHGSVTELWQVLPLEKGLIETTEGPDGIERPQAPFVEGIFWPESPDGENVSFRQRCDVAFTLDTSRGIVRFARPVVKRNASEGTIEPAELYLTAAHGLKEMQTCDEVRFRHQQLLPGPLQQTGPRIVLREDLVQTLVTRYSPNGSPIDVLDNRAGLISEAQSAAAALLAEYQTRETAEIEYAGIIPLGPDGAIHQVVWSGGPEGAVTRAGRMQEFSLAVPSFAERRTMESALGTAEATRRTNRATQRLLRQDR